MMTFSGGVIGVAAGVLFAAIGPLMPTVADTCTDTLACLNTHTCSVGNTTWLTPYARDGKCGCDGIVCKETTICRAWGFAVVPIPAGQTCLRTSEPGTPPNDPIVTCRCDDNMDSKIEVPFEATGCGDENALTLYVCTGGATLGACTGCTETIYGTILGKCLTGACASRVCPGPPG